MCIKVAIDSMRYLKEKVYQHIIIKREQIELIKYIIMKERSKMCY